MNHAMNVSSNNFYLERGKNRSDGGCGRRSCGVCRGSGGSGVLCLCRAVPVASDRGRNSAGRCNLLLWIGNERSGSLRLVVSERYRLVGEPEIAIAIEDESQSHQQKSQSNHHHLPLRGFL